MSKQLKLAPCPFCGGCPEIIKNSLDERCGYADSVEYTCTKCGCSRGAVGDSSKGGYADNSKVEKKALAAWNTRAATGYDEEQTRLDFEEFADSKGFCLDSNFFDKGNNFIDGDTRLTFDIWTACAMAKAGVGE